MIRKPLLFALTTVLTATPAFATDLVQVYELARTADPTLAIAQSTHQNSIEGAVQARAALLPQVQGSTALTHIGTDYEDPSFSTSSRTHNTALQAKQTVFNWADLSTYRAQRAQSSAADLTLASAKQDLITRTATAYFNVLISYESLAAAQANEASAKRQSDYAQKRLAVGLAPITDVYEGRAGYDQARADTITAQNALSDAYQALIEVTGQPVTQLQGLPEEFHPQIPEKFSQLDQLVDTAIANNPGLNAQKTQIRAAELAVTAARAGHYPTLELSGNISKDHLLDQHRSGAASPQQFGGSQFGRSQTNQIALTLTVPIFAGGATQSLLRQALAKRDIEQQTYEKNLRALRRQTRSAYQNLVAGMSEVQARHLAVVSAKSALEASQAGMQVGTRTLLNVVQNQNTLYTAQKAYAQARYNFLLSRLELTQAIGQLDYPDLQDINRLLTTSTEAIALPNTQLR